MPPRHKIAAWYAEAGVDAAMQETPRDYYAKAEPKAQAAPAPMAEPAARIDEAGRKPGRPPATIATVAAAKAGGSCPIEQARAIAQRVTSLEELREAVREFDGCGLKKMATNMVFGGGNPASGLMLVGEAPGAEEDAAGEPFVGASGKLLDKVMEAAGLPRKTSFYITNTVFWRPPGNRQPNAEEVAICEPLVQKHIALVKPKLLVAVGGVSAASLFKTREGITRLRGRSFDYSNTYLDAPIKAAVFLHPAYLLRQPGKKKDAWQDALMLQDLMEAAA